MLYILIRLILYTKKKQPTKAASSLSLPFIPGAGRRVGSLVIEKASDQRSDAQTVGKVHSFRLEVFVPGETMS